MRLDSGKLYKSGTPKRNLLLSISNIDSGYCGHLPRCNRGLPRCVVGLPLCICLLILLILEHGGVIAGFLGSNRLHGSYGRVVEVESAVSGFFPAVPCDRIEVVITEEVITVIPINGIGCVFLALDCLNGGLERVNRSGNDLLVECCRSCVKVISDDLVLSHVGSVREVRLQFRSESIVGCHDKSRLICCPLSICICAVVSALTLLARILLILCGDLIVIVDINRNRTGNRAGLAAESSFCCFDGIVNCICSVSKRSSVSTGFCLPKALGYVSVRVFCFA